MDPTLNMVWRPFVEWWEKQDRGHWPFNRVKHTDPNFASFPVTKLVWTAFQAGVCEGAELTSAYFRKS